MATESVDVWWASPAQANPSLTGLLDEVELRRLDAFRRPEDRQRFVLGSALLRLAVAARRHMAPEQVRLDRTCARCGMPHGKVLPGYGMEASVSHSGSVVLVALREGGGALGVDVEVVPEITEKVLEIAPDILDPAEHSALEQLPRDEQGAGLLRLWTRKEAVLKATGDGLRLPMRDLVVSGPTDPPQVRQWAQRPSVIGQVWLQDLDFPAPVASSHVAALAGLDARPGHVRLRQGEELLR